MDFKTLMEGHFQLVAKQKGDDFYFKFFWKSNLEDGYKAINSYGNIDIIILDLVFEYKAGEEIKSFNLLKSIKEEYPHIPVLMISSTTEDEDLLKAGFDEDCHPDDFLRKAESLNAGMSENKMTPNWEIIYERVIRLLKRFGRINVEYGVLITHGTDTMAWAFAILRYGLANLKTNIALTGSQLPLEGTFSPSDAIGNMLTSVKLLNKIEPPNIFQVFNDGIQIFNKNLNKVRKWSFDAFDGNSFAKFEADEIKVFENGVYPITKDNKLKKLYFIKTGGTIDSGMSETGLKANQNYTYEYLKTLGDKYFDSFEPVIEINPKDSSLFNPSDWMTMISKIGETGLAESDTQFEWNILDIALSPFLTNEFYNLIATEVINNYSGIILLGYGAGNINIFGSSKTKSTYDYALKYKEKFGEEEYVKQTKYCAISLFENIEKYNNEHPENYKFIIMSSQVPHDCYDFEYESGRIPLYYGTLPSGDLSYPEAQTKLAYILGHKDLLIKTSKETGISFEQLVKSCFLSGVKFFRSKNKKIFLDISKKECNCEIKIPKNNVFVKNNFNDGLMEIVKIYKKKTI